jgi:hypothetical protein
MKPIGIGRERRRDDLAPTIAGYRRGLKSAILCKSVILTVATVPTSPGKRHIPDSSG